MIIPLLLLLSQLTPLSYGLLPEGFIYTADLNVSHPILVSLRYGTRNNFVGGVVRGYENVPSKGAVVTVEAGQALSRAQEKFVKDGYGIVIYDSYRPTKAVEHFMEWAENGDVDDSKGSTIDLTLIRLGSELVTNVQVIEKTLNSSYTIFYMEDGTVDMGSSLDIFDEVSHYDNPYIFDDHRRNREYLKLIMESVGFAPYDQEWWHFRLLNEPYPATYFDFDMSRPSSDVSLWKSGTIVLLVSFMINILL